jgi:ABC-type nickel/cobalt efflux system permease component RcnA
VLVLGVLLSAVALTAPERIYAWLGIASGVLLIAIGVTLLRQARRRAAVAPQQRAAELVTAGVGAADPTTGRTVEHGDDHDHAHDHDHDHGHDDDHDHDVTHSHGWGGTHTHPPPATTARGLIAVGFAGGMVPSPSALVVLLGGIALGRAWFGVLLVLGYGIGMALALIGTGLALAHARDRVERWAERHRHAGDESSLLLRFTRTLPTATAGLVIVVGVGLALRAGLTL